MENNWEDYPSATLNIDAGREVGMDQFNHNASSSLGQDLYGPLF